MGVESRSATKDSEQRDDTQASGRQSERHLGGYLRSPSALVYILH